MSGPVPVLVSGTTIDTMVSTAPGVPGYAGASDVKTLGTANASGTETLVARGDHVHAHGAQTDSTLHSNASESANGFMSATDKTKLDGMASGAAAVGSAAPLPVTTSSPVVGSSASASRQDHVHSHGNLAGVDGSNNPLHSIPSYALSSLPLSPSGRFAAWASDGNRGLRNWNGSSWFPSDEGQFFLEQFGGKADGVTDNLAAFNAVLLAMGSAAGQIGATLKLLEGVYYCSDSLHVTRVMSLIGQGGHYSFPRTWLQFPAGKKGVIVDYVGGDGGTGQASELRSFGVQQKNSAPTRQNNQSYPTGSIMRPIQWTGYVFINNGADGVSGNSAPIFPYCLGTPTETEGQTVVDGSVTWTAVLVQGVKCFATTNIDDLFVSGFEGDGIRLYGNTSSSIADIGYFQNTASIQNLSDGVCLFGTDANQNVFVKCNFTANGTWGVRDLAASANQYYGIHARGNGSIPWVPNANWIINTIMGPVQQNGYQYEVTIAGTGGGTSPVFPTTIGATVADGEAVFTCVRQHSGGAYYSRGSKLDGCYSESDQQPSFVGTTALVVGGTHGAGFQTDDGTQGFILQAGGDVNTITATNKVFASGLQSAARLGTQGPQGASGSLQNWSLLDSFSIPTTILDLQYASSGGLLGFYRLMVDTVDAIQIGSALQNTIPIGGLYFPNGFYSGNYRHLSWASSGSPPTSGARGDISFNELYGGSDSGSNANPPAWVCNTAGSGTAKFSPLASWRQRQLLQQTNVTMAAADTGTVYESKASGVRVDITACGDHVGVVGGMLVSDSNGMRLVAPSGGYKINFGGLVSASGGYFESTQIGATLSWVSDTSSNGIKILSLTGVWNIDGISVLDANGAQVVAKTSNYNVSINDQQNTFTNAGAGGEVDFTLPAAVVGRSYSASVETAHLLKFVAVGSDVFRLGASASSAAGSLSSSTVGSSIVIQCTATGVWTAFGPSGTWGVT